MADRLDIFLDDEPEPQPARRPTLEVTLDDLDDALGQPLPGLSPGQGGVTPYAIKAKGTAHTLGSVLWQTALAGTIGGCIGWLINEPLFTYETSIDNVYLHIALFGLLLGCAIGAALGAVEGIASRAINKALAGGVIGLGIGAGGGILGSILGQFIYASIGSMGNNLVLLLASRMIGWAIIGGVVGLGQGIAIRSSRKILNGLIGGLIGGGIGGLLFDPICFAVQGFRTDIDPAIVSRGIAITVLGGCAGLAIGMVEELTKQAWLRITQGWLTGKEFILYHAETVVGNSPSCQITIPKDPAIQPQHFCLRILPDGYALHALQGAVQINGRVVQQARLRNGDQIAIGNTVFTYAERVAKQGKPSASSRTTPYG